MWTGIILLLSFLTITLGGILYMIIKDGLTGFDRLLLLLFAIILSLIVGLYLGGII